MPLPASAEPRNGVAFVRLAEVAAARLTGGGSPLRSPTSGPPPHCALTRVRSHALAISETPMPLTLDIFNDDAFGVASLTTAYLAAKANTFPTCSTASLRKKAITTTSVMIERDGDALALVPVARGAVGRCHRGAKRDSRSRPFGYRRHQGR